MAKLTKIVVNLPEDWKSVKLPPQAVAILETLENRDYSVSEMVAHIKAIAENGTLETTQRPYRIFQYYRAKYIENNFMKLA